MNEDKEIRVEREQKIHMGDAGKDCLNRMMEYIYRHKTAFKLLIDCASGTGFENMLHELTEAEIATTHRFTLQMKEMGVTDREISPELEHILVSGMFAGLFDLITHDVPPERAAACAEAVHDFHSAGWRYLLNLPDTGNS